MLEIGPLFDATQFSFKPKLLLYYEYARKSFRFIRAKIKTNSHLNLGKPNPLSNSKECYRNILVSLWYGIIYNILPCIHTVFWYQTIY